MKNDKVPYRLANIAAVLGALLPLFQLASLVYFIVIRDNQWSRISTFDILMTISYFFVFLSESFGWLVWPAALLARLCYKKRSPRYAAYAAACFGAIAVPHILQSIVYGSLSDFLAGQLFVFCLLVPLVCMCLCLAAYYALRKQPPAAQNDATTTGAAPTPASK